MEIFNPNSNIDFMRWRWISVGIGIALVVISVALIFVKGLDYGLDFTGGVLVEVEYQQPIDANDARKALAAAGMEHALVQGVAGTTELSVRLQPQDVEGAAEGEAVSTEQSQVEADRVADEVMDALRAAREDVVYKRHAYVGPQVGAELRNNGVVAVIFVIVGIMIYLGIRFERRFAISALLTEVHDTLVTVGIIALMGREFDMTVLASVLAVVGYSVNDKVVVFDRVRELFRSARKADAEEILNRSINNTLSRTLITSLFTGITMGALYVYGGPVVHGFAVTMLIGIVVGTLSSIFIASPILLWLGVSKKDLMPVTKDNPELARRP